MDTQKYFCNNCGNYGHLFYNCRKPITSFGIVCYRYNQDQNKNNENSLEYLRLKKQTANFKKLNY